MRLAIDAVGIRVGGGASILKEFLHWLPIVRPAWDFELFVLPRSMRDFPDPVQTEHLSITEVPSGDSGVGRLTWQNFHLPGLLRRSNIDALLCLANVGSLRPPVPQVVFFQQMLALDKPAVSRLTLRQALNKRVLSLCIRTSLRRSSRIVVQTRAMEQALSSVESKVGQKTTVIPSGLRRTAGSEVRPEIVRLLQQATSPRILYVAQCYEHKNHAVLLEALCTLRRSYPEISLLLTAEPDGDTTPAERRVVRKLTSLAERLHVEQHVHWLGKLTPAEVDLAFQKCEVAAFPSLAESFGLPLVEAMAANCPLVAADLPYAHEVAGSAALYFDPHSPVDIAECLMRMLGDEALAASLRDRGALRAKQFCYENSCESLVRLIERIAESPSAAESRPRLSRYQIANYFDARAHNWEKKYGPNGSMRHRISIFTAALKSYAQPSSAILDFGCGSGDITAAAHRAGFQAQGVDQSPLMIERARERFGKWGIPFQLTDSQDTRLPFASNTFGAFIASSVLEYAQNYRDWLRELRRVCQRDALGLVTVPNLRHPLRLFETVENRTYGLLRERRAQAQLWFADRPNYLRLSCVRLSEKAWQRDFERTGWRCFATAGHPTPLILFYLRAC